MGFAHHASVGSELWLFGVVILVAIRQVREQKRYIEGLWIAPVILVCLIGWGLWQQSASASISGWSLAGGAVAGILIGLMRAATIKVRPSAEPRTVIVQGSWLTLAVWAALFAVRLMADTVWADQSRASAASTAVLALLAGTVLARTAAVYYKARRVCAT